MKLHYRHFPCDKPQSGPLLVLHGLFGSRNNWAGAGRRLSAHREVYALDLRNHGDSPHAATMTFDEMAGDVLEFIQDRSLARCTLLGHSMGGKTAMQLALSEPDRITALIAVDIAPRVYPPRHEDIFAAIDAIDEADPATRSEAEKLITSLLPDKAMRLFLLTSLVPGHNGPAKWRTNMRAIRENYEAISAAPQGHPYEGPALFIRGSRSSYVRDEDEGRIKALFPRSTLETLDAAHWVHIDAPEAFVSTVEAFLASEP